MLNRVLFSGFLYVMGGCQDVAKLLESSGWLPGIAKWFLGCFGRLSLCCQAVTRVLWVVTRDLLGGF